ncbi:MAG: hypothetical protein LC100_09845, partial [Chitinophagales bacterium]|nr:hypothetical protein [Chitinophagales bacterium]
EFIRISKEFERIRAIYDKMADAQRINTSFFYPTSPSFFADNLYVIGNGRCTVSVINDVQFR